jgi:hypothetical protein
MSLPTTPGSPDAGITAPESAGEPISLGARIGIALFGFAALAIITVDAGMILRRLFH